MYDKNECILKMLLLLALPRATTYLFLKVMNEVSF